jgi:ATP-binding cassette subfamily B protein
VEIEIREPGRAARRVTISEAVELGRAASLIIEDEEVSRAHLRLTPSAGGFIATDLGSANGTTIDGKALVGECSVGAGAVVLMGTTRILIGPELAGRVDVEAPVAEVRAAEVPVAEVPVAEAPARPEIESLATRANDAGSVRFRPGSAGERAVAGVLGGMKKARKRMAGLGSEAWGIDPEVVLVDPIPDPDNPGQIMTSGTLIEPGATRIWMVVTNEAPPEPVARSLALLFGASLPAAAELGVILEGYGLLVAGLGDPNPQLREQHLPVLGTAGGDLGAAMALSFVRFLVDRGGEDTLRKLVGGARPGRVDAVARELYGETMGGLEEAWRNKVAGGPAIRSAQFLRLSLRYLRPYAWRQAELCAYMLLGLGFNVVFPFATERLFDHALPSGRFSEVISLLVVLGVAFGISLVAGLRQTALSAYVSGSIIKKLRMEMFDRIQTLHEGWFNDRDQSDVLARMFSDVAVVESGLSQALRAGLFQIITLVAMGFVVLRLNLLLGGIVLVSAPLVALIYRLMGEGAQKRSLSVQESSNSLLGVTAENYLAQPVVKAFGLQAHEQQRFSGASGRLFAREYRLALFGGWFGLSVNAVVTVLRLSVLGLGAWLILHHHMTIGALVAFLSVMAQVISPVTALTTMGQALQQCTGALVRVNEILNAEPDIVDPPNPGSLSPLSHQIELRAVSFAYTPERQILDSIDLTVPAGARFAFVGPSGAGKSSILGLLQRNYDPDAGAVLFDDRDLRSVSLASVRAQIGVVFQDVFLFDSTIRENIALGSVGATDAEVVAAAEQAGVSEFAGSLPRGLDTMVGERGGRLSGGQRQRVAIARALVRNPRILILDEATSALDPRTERQIADTLRQVGRGRTTIAVTHRLASVADFDRIVVLNAGRVVEQGTHHELVAMGGLYARLWAEQSGGALASPPDFDVIAALARVPLFADLHASELYQVALRMVESAVPVGGELAEAGEGLVMVTAGRAVVEGRSIGDLRAVVAELNPGDVYGLSATLGEDTGTVLRAAEPLRLLLLAPDRLAALAAMYPQISAVLSTGTTAVTPAPRSTQRLARLRIGGPVSGMWGASPPAPGADAPATASIPLDVAAVRQTGAFQALPSR